MCLCVLSQGLRPPWLTPFELAQLGDLKSEWCDRLAQLVATYGAQWRPAGADGSEAWLEEMEPLVAHLPAALGQLLLTRPADGQWPPPSAAGGAKQTVLGVATGREGAAPRSSTDCVCVCVRVWRRQIRCRPCSAGWSTDWTWRRPSASSSCHSSCAT